MLKWVFAAFLFSTSVSAQTIQERERESQYQKALEAVENAKAAANQIMSGVKADCLAGIGNTAFCECLSKNIPIAVSFSDYALMMTKTKEEIGYDHLDDGDKKIIDNARAARDLCVKTAQFH